jgi:hypothetical protein
MWTGVSEERINSIFRIGNQPSKKPDCTKRQGRIKMPTFMTSAVRILNPTNLTFFLILKINVSEILTIKLSNLSSDRKFKIIRIFIRTFHKMPARNVWWDFLSVCSQSACSLECFISATPLPMKHGIMHSRLSREYKHNFGPYLLSNLDGQFSIPGRERNCCPSKISGLAQGPTCRPIQWVLGLSKHMTKCCNIVAKLHSISVTYQINRKSRYHIRLIIINKYLFYVHVYVQVRIIYM